MSNFKSHFLNASLGLLALSSAASAQTLFSATETATTGQPITVTGSGFDASTRLTVTRYLSSGSLGTPASMAITSQNAMTLGTSIPTDQAFGMYRIDAASASGTGGSVVVNAPQVKWVNQSSATIGSIVRLIGRNLYPTSQMPGVRIVDTATGASFPAAIATMTNYDVSFIVPTGAIVGHTYTMMVNSNVAGWASEVAAPTKLTVQAAGTDPFGLAMPWGSEFTAISNTVYNIKTDSRLALHAVGDGVADDAPALQAAIYYAKNHGGGTVFLPTGTYNVDDGTSIYLTGTVVLKGEGNSVLRVGYRYTPTVAPTGTWPLQIVGGSTTCGLSHLTILNANGNAAPNNILRGMGSSTTPLTHIFLRYVNFQMNNAKAISFGSVRGATIAGCSLTNTSLDKGPINLNGTQDVTLFNNTFNWRCGRFYMGFCARNVVEKNTFLIDNTNYGNVDINGNGTETGGFETSFSQDLFITNNKFQGYGKGDNTIESEMIMAQRSTVADYWSAGKVVSATSTTLTQALNWSGSWQAKYYDTLDRSFVAITRGTGAGQMRRVTSHDTNSLTVDRPWDVVPDATSVYAVGSYTALDHTITNNTMSNMHCAVMFWEGAVDCAVANNKLTDCGFIMVRSDSESDPRNLGLLCQAVAWRNSIIGNTSTTTSTLTVANIGLSADITLSVGLQSPMGSLALDNSILNNTVTGSNTFVDFALNRYDGIEIVDIQEAGMPFDPLTNLGYNVFGNNISNSLYPYRYALL